MKIDLSTIDTENFMVHQHFVGGNECFLVQPVHIGAKWTKDTMHFRSSVWDASGNLVSASYPKFFNLGEHPELTPVPTSLRGTHLMQKLDGSTLILSRWKGNTIARTRGTVDATKQDNGYEIEYLLAKYPKVKALLEQTEESLPFSLIFEWVSPSNVIVINYGDEPDMVLTGMVYHDSYRLASQAALDCLAVELDVKRPQSYSFDSMEEMQEAVSKFKGVEGLCLYYNDGQNILKVKGNWYLSLHRMKSEVSSLEKVLDVWFDQGQPSYTEFYSFLMNTFDYEIAEQAKGHVSKICDSWKEVEKILAGFKSFAEKVKPLTRKDAAVAIIQAYGQTNRASFVFQLLDGKVLNDDALKKLMFQVLKA